MPEFAWRFLRAGSGLLARRDLDLQISGQDYLPPDGPVIIAARHYHHLYDGVAMHIAVPYPVKILVGLDWVGNPIGKRAMAALCKAAGWPVVHRADPRNPGSDADRIAILRQGMNDALASLEAGHALLIFPEGFPVIDPGYTPKKDGKEFLPFEPGVTRIATLAAARGLDVPIVPAGFHYRRDDRWHVILRFGEPLHVRNRAEAPSVLAELETRVIALSQPPVA
jgi:1-acyl-sn-glycerol-3-phosphate acyltransferase